MLEGKSEGERECESGWGRWRIVDIIIRLVIKILEIIKLYFNFLMLSILRRLTIARMTISIPL